MDEEMGAAVVVRAIIAAREDSDLEAGLKYIAPESLDQGQRASREDWRRKWEHMRAGCPTWRSSPSTAWRTASGSANRYTIRGTHTGDFFGQPPTGERFEIKGMDIVRVRDGRLVEHWAFAEPL